MAAYPIAKPAIPCSTRGVDITRSAPYFSVNPIVQRNTPPNATSSPKTIAVGSVSNATRIASLIAVKRFIRRVGAAGEEEEAEEEVGDRDEDEELLGPEASAAGAKEDMKRLAEGLADEGSLLYNGPARAEAITARGVVAEHPKLEVVVRVNAVGRSAEEEEAEADPRHARATAAAAMQ
jgi:hypothetical protein